MTPFLNFLKKKISETTLFLESLQKTARVEEIRSYRICDQMDVTFRQELAKIEKDVDERKTNLKDKVGGEVVSNVQVRRNNL